MATLQILVLVNKICYWTVLWICHSVIESVIDGGSANYIRPENKPAVKGKPSVKQLD